MITKNQIKTISQLKQKKYRNQLQQFVVEGKKGVEELLRSHLKLVYIVTMHEEDFKAYGNKRLLAKTDDFKKMSSLSTAPDCLAVFEMPELKSIQTDGLIVALDDVRDPGNLGTIIRLCDWFGIQQLVCSEETVDVYNPKVVQATMGSITRVNVVYQPLDVFFSTYNAPIFGTFMDGDTIYTTDLPTQGCIVMGNEANGISPEIEKIVSSRISIPRFGDLQQTESLNVAMATSIVLSEFKRRTL